MTEFITDEMVAEAVDSLRDRLLRSTDRTRRPVTSPGYRESMRAALEAVAPLIAARALRALADEMGAADWGHHDEWGVSVIYTSALRARADRIEGRP